MNISALTDPNPKNYLDINCHNLNCNNLTANNIINNVSSTSTFSAYSTGTRTIMQNQSVTDLCDTFAVPNGNFNMLTNVYTAPIAGDYEINFSFSVTNTGAAQHISLIYSAGAIVTNFSTDFTTTILPQRNSYSIPLIVRLSIGQDIGYFITAQPGIGNVVISNIVFSGKLLQ